MARLAPILLAAQLAAEAAFAAPLACGAPGPGIEAEVFGAPGAEAVCRMAADALTRLSDCGLSQSKPLSLIVSGAIPGGGPACLGAFHCRTDRIELLTPGALAAAVGPGHAYLSIPVDRLFESLLVHELAHALVYHARGAADPSHVTDEYVAYTMQIASLPEADRAALLAALPSDAATDPGMLNAFVLAFAPMAFAAAAWSHFEAEADGCAFVSALVAGDAALPGAGLCPDPLSCTE